MAVQAVNRRLTPPEWYDDRDEVLDVVRWLLDTCEISTISDVLYAFEKPWKYSEEREQMVKARRAAA